MAKCVLCNINEAVQDKFKNCKLLACQTCYEQLEKLYGDQGET